MTRQRQPPGPAWYRLLRRVEIIVSVFAGLVTIGRALGLF
jgi:hypothetical protein